MPATYNEFELNYRFDGHNQPDQLVMNPNGHWYRECQTGYYYSYFFGMKGMVIDEEFDYLQLGQSVRGRNLHADNYHRSANSRIWRLLGPHLQHAAGISVGRETRVSLLPLVLGYARQCRHVPELRPPGQSHHRPVSTGGNPRPSVALLAMSTCQPRTRTIRLAPRATSSLLPAGSAWREATSSLPNLVGHVSYDMLWVGDIARAPEQMEFSSVPESDRQHHQHQRLGILRRRQFWSRVGLVSSLRSSDHSITNFGPRRIFYRLARSNLCSDLATRNNLAICVTTFGYASYGENYGLWAIPARWFLGIIQKYFGLLVQIACKDREF